jgi:hypothetical protein
MKTLEQIRQQLEKGEYEFSRHAFKRAVERNITELEIRHLGKNVRIIEDYPDDKYAPSCLLLGFTQKGRPIHLQISYMDTVFVRIITIYEPDQSEWYDFERRRS